MDEFVGALLLDAPGMSNARLVGQTLSGSNPSYANDTKHPRIGDQASLSASVSMLMRTSVIVRLHGQWLRFGTDS